MESETKQYFREDMWGVLEDVGKQAGLETLEVRWHTGEVNSFSTGNLTVPEGFASTLRKAINDQVDTHYKGEVVGFMARIDIGKDTGFLTLEEDIPDGL